MHTNLTNELHFDSLMLNFLFVVFQSDLNFSTYSLVAQEQKQFLHFALILSHFHCPSVIHIIEDNVYIAWWSEIEETLHFIKNHFFHIVEHYNLQPHTITTRIIKDI